MESVEYRMLKYERKIIDTAHEDLDVDNIFKVPSSMNNMKGEVAENGDNKQEYHVEFNAFGTNHRVKLRTHDNDDELESAFGDQYGAYSMKVDKKTGEKRFLKYANSLGDIKTIKKCIYKGEREDGAVAVYIACKGFNHLLLNKLDGENNEQIEVKKNKKTGKLRASKTIYTDLHNQSDDFKPSKQDQSKDIDERRQLGENECLLYPQKYVSMIIVSSISRVKVFASVAEAEADTLVQFLAGKVSYDRTTTPLGCNVKVRLAGQLLESENNKIIRERLCSEIETELAEVQISHNANNGTNGCCSKFPIIWDNCNAGETKCWKVNTTDEWIPWTSGAKHPVPGIDFTKDGGCYQYWSNGVWKSDDETKSIKYYSIDPASYLYSNLSTVINYGDYIDKTSHYFQDNAAALRKTFGDVDNLQAWTHNDMLGGVGGIGWVGTQCNDFFSTAAICDYYGIIVWLHELGHNLGMGHVENGIMGRRRELKKQSVEYFTDENEIQMENFLINSYGQNGEPRCLENNPPTKAPSKKPTVKPNFIPTNMPTAGEEERCNPYLCGSSNCGPGLSCWMNGVCYGYEGNKAYERCGGYYCDPGLSCHPETMVCTPCSGTESPTFKYIPGGAIGDKCDVKACGGSTCDPQLTCDSDGICKIPGEAPNNGTCRDDLCQMGLTCNPITDRCVACSPTQSPTSKTNAPTREERNPSNKSNENIQGSIVVEAVGGMLGLIGIASAFFIIRWIKNRKTVDPITQENTLAQPQA